MDKTETLAEKKNRLFVVLTGLFLTNALLAEVIGVKIFSLERTLGGTPVAWDILGLTLNFDLTAGVILWPFVFILSDVINEYYGKMGVRRISFLTVYFISYAFVMLFVASSVVPADFWVKINGDLDINEAYKRIFAQSLGIIIGSLIAFLVGQFLDVLTFQWLRKLTGSRNVWLRATGSTLVSQFVDSFVVLFVAFYVFGQPAWSFKQVIAVGIINYIYKFSAAIILSPLLYVAHFFIELYLGKENAEKQAEEASKTNLL
jgi:uncharacterized integral membrane protein (TIGR00697 family)